MVPRFAAWLLVAPLALGCATAEHVYEDDAGGRHDDAADHEAEDVAEDARTDADGGDPGFDIDGAGDADGDLEAGADADADSPAEADAEAGADADVTDGPTDTRRDVPVASDDGLGCNCRATGSHATNGLWAGLLVLAAVARRRSTVRRTPRS